MALLQVSVTLLLAFSIFWICGTLGPPVVTSTGSLFGLSPTRFTADTRSTSVSPISSPYTVATRPGYSIGLPVSTNSPFTSSFVYTTGSLSFPASSFVLTYTL